MLYEIKVLRASCQVETRYTDQELNLGETLTIGSDRFTVREQLSHHDHPLAAAAYFCTLPDGASSSDAK